MDKSAIILQARMNSSRRPYKITALFKHKPLLFWQIKRLKLNRKVKKIIVATTKNSIDDVIEYIADSLDVSIFRGDEDDVMKRYIDASEKFGIENIIRVCGDDPLVDPLCIEKLSSTLRENQKKIGVITASHNKGWLLGTSAEAFSLESLKKAYINATEEEREHVVLHFYKNPSSFNILKIEPEYFYNKISLTVDYEEDVQNVLRVLEYFNGIDFSHRDLIEALESGSLKLPYNRRDRFSI